MTTTAQLVGRSLRLIQVIDARQPVRDADMQTAILALNAMLRRWEADGISLGWQPVENTSEELPLPEEAEEGVAYNLAVRLAPEYGVEVSHVVGRGAAVFLNDILRDQMVATPIQPILGTPMPDGWSNRTVNGSTWYVG